MGKKTYIGVDNTAHKGKKAYFGVDNVAHKVKKIYLGVDNVARRVFGGEGVEYYGQAPSLTDYVYWLDAFSIGDKAVFCGGRNSSGALSAKVDAYSMSLTKSSAPDLSIARDRMGACSTPTHGFVMGGLTSGSGVSTTSNVDTYDTSLTRVMASALKTGVYVVTCATAKDKAICFAGTDSGNGNTFIGEAYDSSLTKQSVTFPAFPSHWYDEEPFEDHTGSSLDDKALFIITTAVYNSSTGTYSSTRTVYYINSSLTVSSAVAPWTNTWLPDLNKGTKGGIYHGGYAVFEYEGTMYGFSTGGTFKNITSLASSIPLRVKTRVSTQSNDYLVYGGGQTELYDGTPTDLVEVYDKSFTRQNSALSLSAPRGVLAATSVGPYALFGGGRSYKASEDASYLHKTVDVFEAND